MRQLADDGKVILMVSSELPEIITVCDRIAVFCEGRLTQILTNRDDMSEDKEEVGETIHAMIHAEKLEKARSLLISTTLSINEISQMCGYPSLQYFYSVFKKAYDTTPKEERHVWS